MLRYCFSVFFLVSLRRGKYLSGDDDDGGDDDDDGGDDGNLNVMTDDCDARPEVFEKRETEKWTGREEGWR